jgi:phage-related minor tail protein
MKDGSRPRPKKLEKISFEEVMGAAGMSGFGALLELRPGVEGLGWQPAAELRLKFLLQGAALAERLGRQTDTLRSLNERLASRVTSLAQALGMLSWMTRSVPASSLLLGAEKETMLIMAGHDHAHEA